MRSVLRLTRTGRLFEATRLIQKALKPVLPRLPAATKVKVKPVAVSRHRRPLGETISELSKLPLRPLKTKKAPKRNSGGALGLQDCSYSCAAGERGYKLYVPKALPDKPRGLIVMLHGCTQDAVDFATGTQMNTIADREGLIIAYPDQTKRANSSGCWNWFNPRDQRHGAGEPAIIAGMTQDLIRRYHIGSDRVFIAGLSAGGAMAVILGHTYPNLYSAVGVHSGLPYLSADDAISAFAAMRETQRERSAGLKPRVIVFQGKADKTVHPSNGEAITANTRKHSEAVASGVSPGGRKFTMIITKDKSSAVLSELWMIEGAGHAWSGGHPDGSYTDSKGPDASKEIVRFFLGGPLKTK